MKFKYTQSNMALGCEVVIILVSDKGQDYIDDIFAQLWRDIFNFEQQFSRFLPTSELSIFNRNGGFKNSISKEFRQLLVEARKIAKLSDGLYNPFILPALQRSGYSRSFVPGTEDDIHDDFSGYKVANIDSLIIGDDWAQIPIKSALDLGGCGKGYLGNQLAKWLPNKVSGYSISLGGDITTYGVDEMNHNWTISIQKSGSQEGISIGEITMPTSAFSVATSGVNKRSGTVNGKFWHHIIDPRTQESAITDISFVTLITESCLKADVLASCGLIAGEGNIDEYLHSRGVTNGLIQFDESSLNKKPILLGDMIKLS
jgi:FAD:protein FMN transferase